MKRLDLVGRTFGSLEVLSFAGVTKVGSHTLWNCLCSCGRKSVVRGHVLIHSGVKTCRKCFSMRGKKLATWKGVGEISGTYLYHLKYKAKKRGLVYEVAPEYLWALFELQNRRCALSGEPIFFTRNILQGQTASLDRIDSSIGYVEGNVQWVHKDVNRMKLDLESDKFVEWCKKIASTQTSKMEPYGK